MTCEIEKSYVILPTSNSSIELIIIWWRSSLGGGFSCYRNVATKVNTHLSIFMVQLTQLNYSYMATVGHYMRHNMCSSPKWLKKYELEKTKAIKTATTIQPRCSIRQGSTWALLQVGLVINQLKNEPGEKFHFCLCRIDSEIEPIMVDNTRWNGTIHSPCAQEHRKQLSLSLTAYNIGFRELQSWQERQSECVKVETKNLFYYHFRLIRNIYLPFG